jgi:hypothetical protein
MLSVIGCSTGGGPRADRVPVAERCQPADEQAGLIADRLTNGATELRRPRAVELHPPEGQYELVVAAEVVGEGLTSGTIGVWGVGSWLGGARIMGIDDVARRWSDWGAAIPSRSPAGEQRSRMAARPEVEAARACVESYANPR